MAVIHEERHGGRLYQIRTAGASVRLYTNGVFHSQYSPSRRASTSMWDLLTMPALLADHGRPEHVLVLGVGGGAVLRKISETFDAPRIVGVELDPVHLSLGRRYFGLDRPNIELVTAEAGAWLAAHHRQRFDLIVDDLFIESNGQPRRALAFEPRWLDSLAGMLTPGGAIAVNFADLDEFLGSAAGRLARNDSSWASGYSMRLPCLHNVVAGFGRCPVSMVDFVTAINARFGRRAAADCSVRRFPRTRSMRRSSTTAN